MSHADRITRLLEKNTAAGARLSTVFGDWLDLTHHSLLAVPRHLAAVQATGRFADDTPETAALFARLRDKYRHQSYWDNFGEAEGILFSNSDRFWEADFHHPEAYGFDLLGAVYMLTSANPHSGQFFTPWDVAEMMARMTIADGAQEIADRLRQARQRASARADANSHLLAATILAGFAMPQDETPAYFLDRVLPLIVSHIEPLTICDPCIGSGVMMLAAARQFPAWAVHAGLVQFYGMDIDQTCVTMAQSNALLYGLNGTALRPALFASRKELATLPEPFVTAYSLAQDAHAAGDDAQVEQIAAALRTQQLLFNPDDFAVAVSPPLAPGGERAGERQAALARSHGVRGRAPRPAPDLIVPTLDLFTAD
jgi:hypothetical protein